MEIAPRTMPTRPTLPYYAPAESLPGPSPTLEEILSSKERISEQYDTVVRVRDHYLVKYACATSMQEGENMLFVQQATDIPIPKVYAIYQDEVDGFKHSFIVMEYVPGKTMASAWATLDALQKRDIVSQLRRHMDALRSIPSPGYYGGIWRQPIKDDDFVSKTTGWPYTDPEVPGPHETEEQWVEAMCICFSRAAEAHHWGPEYAEREQAFFRRHYHAVFQGHPPVFTHANLCPVNVIIRDDDGSVVIIDWENAGWSPSFYEYCNTVVLLRHQDDWDDWVYEVLDPYAAEMGWFRKHRLTVHWGN